MMCKICHCRRKETTDGRCSHCKRQPEIVMVGGEERKIYDTEYTETLNKDKIKDHKFINPLKDK